MFAKEKHPINKRDKTKNLVDQYLFKPFNFILFIPKYHC